MNSMRMGLFCALVGWMAADVQAQLGTYGSPDPIPLGQYAPQPSYVPAVATRGAYATAVDNSGPKLTPAPYGNIPQPPSESSSVSAMLNEPGTTVSPSSGCNVLPTGGYIKDAGNCDARGDVCGDGGCCSNRQDPNRCLAVPIHSHSRSDSRPRSVRPRSSLHR